MKNIYRKQSGEEMLLETKTYQKEHKCTRLPISNLSSYYNNIK